MARPIEATPVLTGKDAEQFLNQVKVSSPPSDDRLRWMESLANQSRSAEQK